MPDRGLEFGRGWRPWWQLAEAVLSADPLEDVVVGHAGVGSSRPCCSVRAGAPDGTRPNTRGERRVLRPGTGPSLPLGTTALTQLRLATDEPQVGQLFEQIAEVCA
ncbi:hypothetical protein GCM10009663_19670 [Kitasatospora arboriphila]|uniref:Uncharacterized protein n=1 Tax=Kitasatospora arboriphila TaxID=258052 RepID=A0ABP4E0T7_9ACTN